MIAGMKKLTLAAPKSDIDALCAELVWLEAVETTDFHPDAFGETGLPEGIRGFDNASALSEAEKRLSRLQNAIETLAPYGSGGKKAKILPESFTRKEFEALADKSDEAFALVERTEDVSARLAGVRAAIARAENDIASLAPFLTFDEPVSMEETRYTRILKGTFPKLVKPDAVRAVLDEAGFDYELNEICETGDYRYVYAITPKEDAEAFGRALNGEGFARILLTGYEGTARDETAALKEKIAGFEAEVNDCFRQYREIAVNRTLLEQVFDYLNSRVSAEHVKQKLLATDSACLLTGWVPNDRLPALEDKLAAFDCCYTLDEPKDTDKVPVKLVNKRLVTPFESVLGLYSYPDYKGVDPTFVMSIFYFIIFGLIMQDVVYGLILLIGGKALIKALRAKPGSTMYKMLDMFSICGVSTMICGVLFGGYFGDLPSAFARNMLGITDFPEIAVAFNPVTNPMPYLILSLGMGVVHLVAGMLMKAYMLVRDGHALDAVFDVGMWLVLFAGIGLLFVVPEAGKWTALAGAAGLILTQGRAEKNIVMKLLKGIMSLYDIVSYISDLLSYSRIMALGLSGVIIAQVVNLIGTLGGPTVVGFLVLILAMVLGHALNLALSLLGAFVHTARLQYIEFFGKFYIDGGEPFRPAAVQTKYTEIIKEAK